MYIILAIFVFGLLIVSHELGHFGAAKLSGVRVVEFSVGMGPAIVKRQRGETLYSLRALPIGGYCAMEEDSASEDPRAFTNQPLWKRLLILVSGAAMNLLLGFLIILLLSAGTTEITVPVVSGFMEGCPYESAEGFRAGDEIYKVNGERVRLSSEVSLLMSRSSSGYFDFVLIRDGQKVYLNNYKMELREYLDEGEIKVKYGLVWAVQSLGALAKVKYARDNALGYVRMIKWSLVDLIAGRFAVSDLSGPVGIVGVISEVGSSSATALQALAGIANLAAFITINLAVMNLLPLPALDGGRVLFMLITFVIEKITRRKLDPKYEGYIHGLGLALLLGLSALVMYNDIVRLIRGG